MEFTFCRTVFIENPVDLVLDWCRSREARGYWPGTVEVRSMGNEIVYEVLMKAPGVPPARLSVKEYPGPIESWVNGGMFVSEQTWRWPSGEESRAWSTYHCEGRAEGTELELTMRVILPEAVEGQALDTERLSRAINHAAAHYLDGIAGNVHTPRRPGDGFSFRISGRGKPETEREPVT
ncbi:MAG: hypothetical protein AB1679_00635 [Actinomycetota bacterium]